MKLQKALAVIGAGVLLFAATDAITYAATGSSLVLGKINAANATTTIQNTGTTPALKLLTASNLTAPMAVNGKGKVTNLYADRAATADNASKVGGKTVAQVRSGIDAATVGGQTVAQVRAGIDAATVGGQTVAQVVSSVPRPAEVVWVAQSGGQFTSVSAALASITDNGVAHPYVIKVAPGTYTESGGIDMKNYVDLEGSGQETTTVACTCASATNPQTDGSSATLRADGATLHGEVRNLTITNSGATTYVTGIWTHNIAAGQLSLRDVTVTATATGAATTNGVYDASSSPKMNNVRATASGGANSDNYGVSNISSSSPTMTNLTATANGGAQDRGVYDNSSSPTMINVIATGTGGSNSNYGVANDTGSPTMNNVTATATATGFGSYSVGVSNNSSSSPTMTYVTATATGGILGNTGVSNNFTSSPTMTNVTATAAGGTNSYGVNNSGSSPIMTNVTATATGPNVNAGVNNNTSSPTIRNSNITGTITWATSGVIRIYNSTITSAPPGGSGSICSGTFIASSGTAASCS
jgi:hypothetical protein